MPYEVIDEVRIDPVRVRGYAEGWQSWSPTRVFSYGERSYRPDELWQHAMRFRPGYEVPADGLQAEGVLAIEPGTGAVGLGWVSESTTDVASIRLTWLGDRAVIAADGPVRRVDGLSVAGVLAAIGDGLSPGELKVAPRVWCSWYHYFEQVTAAEVRENLAAMDASGLPYDVVQIDDGWSLGNGEYQRPSEAFGDVAAVIDEIRASGRRAGLWFAPFIVGEHSSVARDHPEWLLGYAGHNWGDDMVGLDVTHPGVRDHLARIVGTAGEQGVSYLKLDFLYGGALPGGRYDGSSPGEAYASGLDLIRAVAGPETYLVGCGAPILPSIGRVDAMRVSPDTFHEGGEDGSRGLRGAMSCASRTWQDGRLWVNDPDCLVARPSYALREEWASIVEGYGGLRSTSDRLFDLDEWGLNCTEGLLAADPTQPSPSPMARIERGLTAGMAHRHP